MKKTTAIVLVALFAVGMAVFSFAALGKSDEKNFYFISSKRLSKTESAGSFVAVAKERGGAGYVFESGGEKHVLLMGYSDKSSAEKIIENLPKEYYIVKARVNNATLSLAEKAYGGIVEEDKNSNEYAARAVVLSVAKELKAQNDSLYNLAMKTYSSSKEMFSSAIKYLYIAILLS